MAPIIRPGMGVEAVPAIRPEAATVHNIPQAVVHNNLVEEVAAGRHTLLQAGVLPMPSPVPQFITLPRPEGQHRT